jgi:hypothetical protein
MNNNGITLTLTLSLIRQGRGDRKLRLPRPRRVGERAGVRGTGSRPQFAAISSWVLFPRRQGRGCRDLRILLLKMSPT